MLIDVSHDIRDGMTTYKGLPGPMICDFLSRENSRGLYPEGTEFQIGRIDMVANTGTYLDSPFHRFEHGRDLAELDLAMLADLEALVVRKPYGTGLAVDVSDVSPHDVRSKAVLIHTGWDVHWGEPAYLERHPFVTAAAAEWLKANGAVLVGIDSHNIDDTSAHARPVHTTLLGADILICEHMTNLGQLPEEGFRFFAVPPKVVGLGTFPVRAFASISDGCDQA